MSMLYCPECGERVSSRATTCPHCGLPIDKALQDDGKAVATFLKRLLAEGNRQSLIELAADESARPDVLGLIARVGDLEVARRLAQNTGSSPSVLARLAYLDDKEIIVSVAKNPRTSPETLAWLYKRIAGKVSRPMYGYYVRSSMSGHTKEAMIESRAVKVALALNRNTPVDVLSRLYDDRDYIVSAAVFGNCKLPERFFTDYMCRSIEKAGPCGLLNPYIPYRDLVRQFGIESLPSLQVAKNSRMYGFEQERFDSWDGNVYRYVEAVQGAGFPRLPQESLEAIKSIGAGFPKTIVLNPAATLDVLVLALGESLARDVWIAKDPHTPRVVIEKLYRDHVGIVRVAAAMNPNLPAAIFAKRFARPNRNEEARSDDCTPSPDELDYSGWESHSDWAEYGIGADVEYWNEAAMEELQPMIDADKAAWAEAQDAIEIAEYERSEEERYLSFLEEYAFASNPSTPVYALQALSRRGGDIARAVALNPGAPQGLLRRLFDTEGCWDAVIMNPSCSISLLESLDNDGEATEGVPSNTILPGSLDEEIPF